jgi:tRNA U34 2-thiouridine synthase MnmA/TrmU
MKFFGTLETIQPKPPPIEKMRKTIIHLLSGGLDSVTMLYDLHQNHAVHCLLLTLAPLSLAARSSSCSHR